MTRVLSLVHLHSALHEGALPPRACRLGEQNGIDVALQCVALYKGRDPGTAEEEEFMQV